MESSLQHLQANVIDCLDSYGIACDQDQAALLLRHLELVIEKNKVVNLTRITNPEEAVVLHIVDSLLPLAVPEVKKKLGGKFLDMGTGAGFPGIPYGILSEAPGALVDSVGKKVAAVVEFCSELGLDGLSGGHFRLEDYATSHRGEFDVVLARAVAQSNVLVEYASPLLSNGGILVLEKAKPEVTEINASKRAAKICGLSLVDIQEFELPNELGHRTVIVYRKTHKPEIKLPRRNGLAKNEPLGL